MNSIIRNTLAVIIGLIVGSVVNIALVTIGPKVIPLPDDIDAGSIESLQEKIKLLTARHFVFPFLAHALGTLTGAFIAAKLAASHHINLALLIGVFFLIGGAMAARMIGGPLLMNFIDLVFAYLPMAYLGGRLGNRNANATK